LSWRSSRRQRRHTPAHARLAPVLALVGVAALCGCSKISSMMPFSSGSKEAPAATCPGVAILHSLAQTAVFKPGAPPQPIGVAFYGILDDVSSKCDRSGDALRVSLDVVVIGERGPSAERETGVDLQYFVAVTGPNEAILSKRSLPVHVTIPITAKRAGVTDHIVEAIPLAGHNPADLGIVLGFQQSPAVVDFYHHFRGR
jgi:hypothetical protein